MNPIGSFEVDDRARGPNLASQPDPAATREQVQNDDPAKEALPRLWTPGEQLSRENHGRRCRPAGAENQTSGGCSPSPSSVCRNGRLDPRAWDGGSDTARKIVNGAASLGGG